MPKYSAEGRFEIVFTASNEDEADRHRDNLVARMAEAIEDGVIVRESTIGSILRLVSDDHQLTMLDHPENASDAS